MGDTKGGPFDIPGDVARRWLQQPANPNGRPNADVLKPWMNGMDVTRRPAGKWIIDFGWQLKEREAALYEEPFRHIQEHVYPMRQRTRRESYRAYWWRHVEPRPGMWKALAGLSRYIATPTVSKHRLFVWLDARICPDHQLIVIARDDDTTLWHPAQSISRSVVPQTRHQFGRPAALHADHHLRELPLPRRADARRTRRQTMLPTRAQAPSREQRGGWSSYATAGSTRPSGLSGLKSRCPSIPNALSPGTTPSWHSSRDVPLPTSTIPARNGSSIRMLPSMPQSRQPTVGPTPSPTMTR